MKRRTIGVSFLAVLALSTVSCGAVQNDEPSPAEPSSRSAGPPLDARGRSACSVLAREQLASVSMDSTTAVDRSNSIATACGWKAIDGSGSMTLVINVDQPLELILAARGVVNQFEEFELRGYRAVREGGRDQSLCSVYVGIAESQVFVVEMGTRSTDVTVRPCDVAQMGAEAVLDSLSSRS